jgi:hypothetical protein
MVTFMSFSRIRCNNETRLFCVIIVFLGMNVPSVCFLRAFIKSIKTNHWNLTHIPAGGSTCTLEDEQVQTEVAACKTVTIISAAHALVSHCPSWNWNRYSLCAVRLEPSAWPNAKPRALQLSQ